MLYQPVKDAHRIFPDRTYQFSRDGADVKLRENEEKLCAIHFLEVA
jgi:hypothetical protein